MTKDEALKKCLRALEPIAEQRMYEAQWVVSAILACKEALEQPTQEWQGLSEDELLFICEDFRFVNKEIDGNMAKFAKAIEQKLKDKNS